MPWMVLYQPGGGRRTAEVLFALSMLGAAMVAALVVAIAAGLRLAGALGFLLMAFGVCTAVTAARREGAGDGNRTRTVSLGS